MERGTVLVLLNILRAVLIFSFKVVLTSTRLYGKT